MARSKSAEGATKLSPQEILKSELARELEKGLLKLK